MTGPRKPKNRSNAVTDEDINKLWECQQMGSNTPESIINTIWFYSTIHFGTRSAKEHRNICWGDINFSMIGRGKNILNLWNDKLKLEPGKM